MRFLPLLALCFASVSNALPEKPITVDESLETMNFSVQLAAVGFNYRVEGGEVYSQFQEIIDLDPKLALTLSEFWKTKAEVSLFEFIRSKQIPLPEGSPLTEAKKRSIDSIQTAYSCFYFDHWDEIKKMISSRLESLKKESKSPKLPKLTAPVRPAMPSKDGE